MGRSILAIVVGYLVTGILVAVRSACMTALIPAGPGPPTSPSISLQVVSLVLDFGCAMVGGYITAWIARRNEVRHALILGLIMTLIGIALLGMPGTLPLTYRIALAIIATPGAALGGMIRERQKRSQPPAGVAA